MIEPIDEMVAAVLAETELGDHDDTEPQIRRALAAVLALVERDREADGIDLCAVVWHSPDEPHPDGRRTSIVTDRAQAIEDAAHYTAQARRMGAGDHRYVAYRLVPLSPAAPVTPPL